MALPDALDRYFAAWNAHDGEAVVASLAPAGTYEDPTTGGPIGGEALAASVAGLVRGFPDVAFEVVDCSPTGPTSAVARWRMRGTNTGPTPDGPPTGGTVDLDGVDLIAYDPATDRLSSVVGYFDTAGMYRQLGLQIHLSPADVAPIMRFGISSRVDTGREATPGAFTVTWIEIEPETFPTLMESTTAIVMEQLGNTGYLGSCFASIGNRHLTFTAWESTEAARRALQGGAHAAAMRLANGGGLGAEAQGVTSVWEPVRMNDVFAASKERRRPIAALGGQWL